VDICSTPACGQPATLAWQQYATDAQETAEIGRIRRAIVALARTSPAAARARIAALDLAHLRPMTLMVFGCDLHKLDPEAAALVQGTPTVAPPAPPPPI
jgi:hypothetical protein